MRSLPCFAGSVRILEHVTEAASVNVMKLSLVSFLTHYFVLMGHLNLGLPLALHCRSPIRGEEVVPRHVRGESS